MHERLLQCADALLAGGFTTIVDATFIHRGHRQAFAQLAARSGAPIRIVRCEAPAYILKARIEERASRGTDPSDADLSVLQWQLAHDEPFDSDEAGIVLRLSSEDTRILDTARTRLGPLLQRFTPFDSLTA